MRSCDNHCGTYALHRRSASTMALLAPVALTGQAVRKASPISTTPGFVTAHRVDDIDRPHARRPEHAEIPRQMAQPRHARVHRRHRIGTECLNHGSESSR